jgi:hypothetical protein
MITLFENITEDLTELEETSLVPMVTELLQRTSDNNSFTAKRMIKYFIGRGYPISQARVSKMIAYIRVKNLMSPNVVIGGRYGYFITADETIIEDQIESLQGRCDAIEAIIDSLKSQLLSVKRMKESV